MASLWNSLEIAKFAASILTPVTIVVLGIYVHRVTKRFEDFQWRSQKLVEKRIAIYDDLAPLFNDLLCYFTYVGCWKELRPTDVISLKRKLDRQIYLAAPLFATSFFKPVRIFSIFAFRPTEGGEWMHACERMGVAGRKLSPNGTMIGSDIIATLRMSLILGRYRMLTLKS